MDNPQNKVVLMLGEITGELKGIQRQIQTNTDATNQRIDDLKRSIDVAQSALADRITQVEKRLDKVEERNISQLLRNASWGGIGGAMAAAVVEILKVIKG